MKKINIVLFLTIVLFQQKVHTEPLKTELDLITEPLEAYLSGHIKGDNKILGSALHEEGKLSYLREGEYRKLTFPVYLNRMKLRDTEDGIQRIPYIKHIEVTGDVAIAKLVLDYSTIHFTDYMTLYKINNEWKITNKIAYSVRDPDKNKPANSDIKDVVAALHIFVQATKTKAPYLLKTVVYKESKAMFMQKGQYTTLDFEPAMLHLTRKARHNDPLKNVNIQSVDVTGNAAVGKVIFEYGDVIDVYFLSLLKIGNAWRIVNIAL